MAKYKLTYFDSRGFGETARYMFALSGVEYVDHRIKSEEWDKVKQGLLGSDSIEEAKINVVYEVLVDSLQEARKVVEEADPEVKEERKRRFYEEILEAHSEYLVKLLKSNNGGEGFFVGEKVTLADIFFLAVRRDILTYVDKEDQLDRHPPLKDLVERVGAIPEIAEWIKRRPAN